VTGELCAREGPAPTSRRGSRGAEPGWAAAAAGSGGRTAGRAEELLDAGGAGKGDGTDEELTS
jgi:hypothetical protein